MIECVGENKPFDWKIVEEWPDIFDLKPNDYDPYTNGGLERNLVIAYTDNPFAKDVSDGCCRVYWEEFELTCLYRENGGNNFEHDLEVSTGRLGTINETARYMYAKSLYESKELLRKSLIHLQTLKREEEDRRIETLIEGGCVVEEIIIPEEEIPIESKENKIVPFENAVAVKADKLKRGKELVRSVLGSNFAMEHKWKIGNQKFTGNFIDTNGF